MPLPRSSSPRTGTSLLAAACVAAGVLMAVPQAPLTPDEARAEREAHALRLAEQELGSAIDRYRAEHGALPGRVVATSFSDVPDAELLVRQLRGATDARGHVGPAPAPTFPLGPYLPDGPPVNPLNGRAEVRLAGPEAPADGSAGWIVDPATGQVRSDAVPQEEPR